MGLLFAIQEERGGGKERRIHILIREHTGGKQVAHKELLRFSDPNQSLQIYMRVRGLNLYSREIPDLDLSFASNRWKPN